MSGARSVAFVLPTGAGKTITFAHILAGAVRRGRHVLILTHRQEIIDQIEVAMTLAAVHYGIIAPGHVETDAPVQIASIATLARRPDRWRDRFDFIVIDECHHAVAKSWSTVLGSQPRAWILGVTATPERLDGRGLRETFDDLVIGTSTAALIAGSYLSPFIVYEPTPAPDLSKARIRGGDFAIEDVRQAMGGVVIGAAVKEYLRLCPGATAVAFCPDVSVSKLVAARFRKHGMRALHVDGDTPAAERRAAIAALGSGDLDVLTNCSLFGEGIDVPALGAVILLRPTASLAMYLQQVGRALRVAPGKGRAVILDFTGNCARHGLPDEPREWSLDSKPRRQRKDAEGPRLRRCGGCGALNRAVAHACAGCGGDVRTPRERAEIEMQLRESHARAEADQVARMTPGERRLWAGADERRLRVVARVSGYKPGWVYHAKREAEQRMSAGGRA